MRRAVVVLLIFILNCAVSFGDPLLPGSGPAGPQIDRRVFDGVWTHRPVRFIGIGDSITAGYLSDHHHSYYELLAENAPDELPEMAGVSLYGIFPQLHEENRAVSGTTSRGHLKHVASLKPSGPETLGWVVMTTGANDLIYSYRDGPGDGAMYGATLAAARPWVESYERRLNKMVDDLQARFPGGCHIFIATIYDPTDGVGDLEKCAPKWLARILGLHYWPDAEAILAEYNGVIARVAQRKGVHLVDVHKLFLGHGIHCTDRTSPNYCAADPHFWYRADVQHPNERGHDAIRREFLRVMATVARDIR